MILLQVASLVAVVALFLIAYQLHGIVSNFQEIQGIRGQLDEMIHAITKATVKLCGDRHMEDSIRETNELGADLTEQQRDYEQGQLQQLNFWLGRIASLIDQILEKQAKKKPELFED